MLGISVDRTTRAVVLVLTLSLMGFVLTTPASTASNLSTASNVVQAIDGKRKPQISLRVDVHEVFVGRDVRLSGRAKSLPRFTNLRVQRRLPGDKWRRYEGVDTRRKGKYVAKIDVIEGPQQFRVVSPHRGGRSRLVSRHVNVTGMITTGISAYASLTFYDNQFDIYFEAQTFENPGSSRVKFQRFEGGIWRTLATRTMPATGRSWIRIAAVPERPRLRLLVPKTELIAQAVDYVEWPPEPIIQTLEIGGPPGVVAEAREYSPQAALTFTGQAGQEIKASGTASGLAAPLYAPDGSLVHRQVSGTWTLPTTGEYRLLVFNGQPFRCSLALEEVPPPV